MKDLYEDHAHERKWWTIRLAIVAGLMTFLIWSCSRPETITYVCHGQLTYSAGTATCKPAKAEG